MFYGCGSLKDASKINIKATNLAPYCYAYMFENCSLLQIAPELPATNLAPYCYNYMFQNCTSL